MGEQLKVKEISVMMGEVKVSRSPAVFSCAGIGSCVLLFVYEPRTGLGGVAHIMLPDSSAGPDGNKGLYADTSPSLLVRRLVDSGADAQRLKAKIVGGANLFQWAASEKMASLGKHNLVNVKRELARNRIFLAAEEIGGSLYKSVKCDTMSGSVYIRTDKDKNYII